MTYKLIGFKDKLSFFETSIYSFLNAEILENTIDWQYLKWYTDTVKFCGFTTKKLYLFASVAGIKFLSAEVFFYREIFEKLCKYSWNIFKVVVSTFRSRIWRFYGKHFKFLSALVAEKLIDINESTQRTQLYTLLPMGHFCNCLCS